MTATAPLTRWETSAASPPIRVAHVVSHPIQYFAPLYRELARRREIDLTVFFYSDETAREFMAPGFGRLIRWDTPLLEGYTWHVLPSAAGRPSAGGFVRTPNRDVAREVTSGRYDVVWAHGYAHLTTWLIAARAAALGVPLLIREEQTLLHGRPWYKRALKQVALRTLFRRSFGLYIGHESRRYFENYGMRAERLFPAPYCVDNDFFATRARELAPRRGAIRATFGIEDSAPVVLFAGKLVAKKRPLDLLAAFAAVCAHRACWLLLVGEGPLRGAIEKEVARRRIPNVRLTGFLNQSEMPLAYAAADVFVLPSAYHETWGLVVNEAMNFALPVIASDKVGCAPDLVRDGWNGFVYPSGNVAALASSLETLVRDHATRSAFGARSGELVARRGVNECADAIVAAARASAATARQGRP